MPDNESTILLITSSPSTLRGVDQERVISEQAVKIETLNRNFGVFMTSVQQIVAAEQTEVGDFALDEISFTAEISVNGEFKLLGTGVGMEASGGITFKLRRQTNTSMQGKK